MPYLITNNVFISILGTAAVVGSTFILEGLFWFLKHLFASTRPRDAFRISMGADTGFGFQLGTSMWVSWLRRTKEGRRRRSSSNKETNQISGVLIITIISVICITSLLALEIGVIYMTQSITIMKTVDDSELQIFTVGGSRDLQFDDWNGDQLEISHHEFSESNTTRYVARAGILVNVVPGKAVELIQKASESENISIWFSSFQHADEKSERTLPSPNRIDRSNIANILSVSVSEAENREFSVFLSITLRRTLDSLESAETTIFTDFGEAEGNLIRSTVFHHLGFNCTFVNVISLPGMYGIGRDDICTLRKRFGVVDSAKTEIEKALKNATKELVPKLFKVSDYTEEREVEQREGKFRATEKYNGTVSIVRGMKTGSTSFSALSIAACLGITKIFTACFIDYGELSRKYLLRELSMEDKQSDYDVAAAENTN